MIMTALIVYALSPTIIFLFFLLGAALDGRAERKEEMKAERDKAWAAWRIEAKQKGWIS